MPHRVHTILSLLAEDHAPAALRPSILLAIDWPTVAEEAPASAADEDAATIAAAVLGGSYGSPNFSPAARSALSLLAARLATVAASLTTTGDKSMAAHATALWGAAAALVGLHKASEASNPAGWDDFINGVAHLAGANPFSSSAAVMLDAVKRWHHIAHSDAKSTSFLEALADKAWSVVRGTMTYTLDGQATLIATALDRVHDLNTRAQAGEHRLRDMGWDGTGDPVTWTRRHKFEHDKALADIHALRDILGEAEGATIVLDLVRKALGWEMGEGPLSDFAAAVRKRADEANAARVTLANVQSLLDKTERCREALRTERDHLRAQVDRMIAAMREDAPAPVKTRPQPGDVVSWAEVEDGALYFSRDNQGAKFHAHSGGHWYWLYGADDSSLERLLRGVGCIGTTGYEGTLSTLVARDLGTNPEAWRKAMREWTASELTRPR